MARRGWAKLSNDMWLSTKIRKLRKQCPSALGTYIMTLSFCSDNLTDGHVTGDELLYQLDASDEDIDALCNALLLESDGNDGYFVHDYLKYQSSKAQVEKQAEDTRKRQQKWREEHSDEASAPVPDVSNAVTNKENSDSNALLTPLPLNTKNQRTEEPFNTPPTPSKPEEEEFERFYEAYPKHVSKPKTLEVWTRLTETGLADPDKLIGSAKAFSKAMQAEGRPMNRIPTPANFLDSSTWQDYAPKKTIQLPGEYWIQEHLTLKLPSGTDSVRARQELFNQIKKGTTPEQAAQDIITEAGAQKILREAA